MNAKYHYFREGRNIGRAYEFEGTTVTVYQKSRGKTRFREVFEFSELDPNTAIHRMHHPALKFGINYLSWIVVAGVALSWIELFPLWILLIVMMVVSLPFLVIVIRFILPMDFEQFRKRTGEVAFDIARFRGHSDEFTEFVGELKKEILKAEEKSSNQSVQTRPTSRPV